VSGSVNSGDLLGGGLGRCALAVGLVVAVLVLIPVGLATVGFGAIVGEITRPEIPSSTGSASQLPIAGALHATGLETLSVSSVGGQSSAPHAHGLIAGWAERGPLNQYARSNYRSDQIWMMWNPADCSAAALDWLLGAYGQQLGSLDDAIALIGRGTGISTTLGLLDARGSALARAVSARGLQPRTPGARPLASIAELKAWLEQGPLLMDGARWFREGHWFVAVGYDDNGIFVRDSSGWDNRYLSWSRLYGEVGFSGWVVGVAAPSP
jgi:hypothetical protein